MFPPSRVKLGYLLALSAGVLLPYVFRHEGWGWARAGLIALGGLGIVLAWPPPPKEPEETLSDYITASRSWPGWGLLLLGLAVGVAATFRVWQRDTDPWGFRLWALMLVALPLGGYLLHPPMLSFPSLRREARYHAVALGLILAGVGVRIYHLDRIPPGIFVDETNAAGDALRILSGWHASPFGVGWFETPLGYMYYMAGLIRWSGPTYMTLKAASLIPAVLTLIAFYLLAHLLFGPRVAIPALAFLAFSRWHMTMSRWGWNEVAPPLFHILAVYFLVKGNRTRNLGHFLLGGVWLGLGMYTYLASRLVVLAVVTYLLYRWIAERGFVQRAGWGIILFFLAYTLTFAPLATTYAKNPFAFLNRSRQVSILNDMKAAYDPQHPLPAPVRAVFQAAHLPTEVSFRPLWVNVIKHARMFHVEGDYNPRHNIPGEPMLDSITGVLFLYGLFYALRYIRDHRQGLLLTWLVIPLLGGILSLVQEAPQAYRTLDAVIAIALLAGEVVGTMPLPLGDTTARRDRIYWGLVSTLLGVAAFLNVFTFFQKWARDDRVWMAFSPMETAVAREVVARLPTNDVYLSPTLYWGSPLRYLSFNTTREGTPPYHLIQPVEDLPLTRPIGNNALFLLDPLYADLLELFTEYYPHTRAEMVYGRMRVPLYLRLHVPRSDIEAVHGLTVTYSLTSGKNIRRREGNLNRRWPRDLPEGVDLTSLHEVVWQGSIYIPHSGMYTLRAEGNLRILVDEVPWTGRRMLGKGLHALIVHQYGEAARQHKRAILMWEGPRIYAGVIPNNYFFTLSPPKHGLWGTYMHGMDLNGQPVFSRVDRTLLLEWTDPEPIAAAFSARWTGFLWAPKDGTYHFRLDADDGVRFWLDGRLLGESWRPDTVNQVQVDIWLRQGWHPLRVEYFQKGGAKVIRFYWRPPGEREYIVPPHVLLPKRASD